MVKVSSNSLHLSNGGKTEQYLCNSTNITISRGPLTMKQKMIVRWFLIRIVSRINEKVEIAQIPIKENSLYKSTTESLKSRELCVLRSALLDLLLAILLIQWFIKYADFRKQL